MRKLNEYGLTDAQEKFLQEYLKTCNGYKSYLVAYPAALKWKRNSVDVKVSLLLSNDKIKQRIKQFNEKNEKELSESTILNKRKILNEIIELTEKCKNEQGSRAVNLQALKLLSQIAGILTEGNNINVNINNAPVVNEVTNYLDL